MRVETHDAVKMRTAAVSFEVRTAALVSGMPVSAVVLDQDWTINIRIGEMYLAWCFEQTGSWQGALHVIGVGCRGSRRTAWINDIFPM